jgi:hypothetical protein
MILDLQVSKYKTYKNIIYLYMSKNFNYNHIFIFILILIVLIYLGKLLYGNLNNNLNYNTTSYDEDTDETDTDEPDTDDEWIETTSFIKPIPNAIITGPINDKADMSTLKISDTNSDEGTKYNSEQ